MSDNYNDVHGEHPGDLNLTTCTGCGEPRRYYGARKGTHCQNCGKPWADSTAPRIAPDEVRSTQLHTVVPVALLQAVLDTVKVVAAGPLDDAGFCICCYRPMFGRNGAAQPNNHTDECPVRLARAQREALDAALAASGDDGGTP